MMCSIIFDLCNPIDCFTRMLWYSGCISYDNISMGRRYIESGFYRSNYLIGKQNV